MNKKLSEKLKTLPRSSGVYFHKSKAGEIIYVGKAAVLKNRVRSYFQNLQAHDVKTQALVAEIHDTDWIETASEIDALFLESEMVKRYMPRYNILLRDDKSQLFARIDMKSDYPYVSFTRQPLDDGASYWGPYFNGFAVKKALHILRKVFPYSTHRILPPRVCLQYHLGLCPGPEEKKISPTEYKKSLRKLIRYIKGDGQSLLKEVVRDMKQASKEQKFEQAAVLRNQYRHLAELQNQIIFGDREFLDISKDEALSALALMLGLTKIPYRIEGYDISHMSGTNNVASMVVATNGLADKKEYRKFKLRVPGNDDFAHMREALGRRFSGRHLEWQMPDLILIDGGKGQLGAAVSVLEEKGLSIPVIGLAKREEEIVIHKSLSHVTLQADKHMVLAPRQPYSEGSKPQSAAPDTSATPKTYRSDTILQMSESPGTTASDLSGLQPRIGAVLETDDFYMVRLPKNSHIVKLLQRIRDESHRFAVSYHTTLKRRGQTTSALDDIPGIGPATRKKLIKKFGSLRGVKAASFDEVVQAIGVSKAKLLR